MGFANSRQSKFPTREYPNASAKEFCFMVVVRKTDPSQKKALAHILLLSLWTVIRKCEPQLGCTSK